MYYFISFIPVLTISFLIFSSAPSECSSALFLFQSFCPFLFSLTASHLFFVMWRWEFLTAVGASAKWSACLTSCQLSALLCDLGDRVMTCFEKTCFWCCCVTHGGDNSILSENHLHYYIYCYSQHHHRITLVFNTFFFWIHLWRSWHIKHTAFNPTKYFHSWLKPAWSHEAASEHVSV